MTRFRKKFAVLLVSAFSCIAAHAATVSVSPETPTVVGDLSQLVIVTIEIDDLGDGASPSLGAFDVALTYDPGILLLVDTTLGDPVNEPQLALSGSNFSRITPITGSINVIELSFDSPAVLDAQQVGSFTLATLRFITFDYGVAALEFGSGALSDASGETLAGEFIDGSITVAAVPPPDSDGDGIPDDTDNCTTLANPDQIDTNGDGFGNRCDADLNDDCTVNTVDLGLLKLAFFGTDENVDFSGDGIVNSVDLGIMKSLFFQAPGPSAVANVCP